MLGYGKIDFEDERVQFSAWRVMKEGTVWGSMPFLTVNAGGGKQVITQSRSLNRYVAKLVGLYPEDADLAAHCDAIQDVVEDIASNISKCGAGMDKEEKAAARKERMAQGDGQ